MYSPHAIPSDFRTLDAYLSTNGERYIAHNTRARRDTDGITIIHHTTPIVTVHPDDTATLLPCAWQSATTRTRQNAVLGSRGSLFRKNWVTYWVWRLADGSLSNAYELSTRDYVRFGTL